MVERFNGRIEDVLQSHHFRSGEEPETTLHRYVWLYNQQPSPQSALGSKTPLQAMKNWHKLKPELFNKHPYYRPGCDRSPRLGHREDGASGPCPRLQKRIPPAAHIRNCRIKRPRHQVNIFTAKNTQHRVLLARRR